MRRRKGPSTLRRSSLCCRQPLDAFFSLDATPSFPPPMRIVRSGWSHVFLPLCTMFVFLQLQEGKKRENNAFLPRKKERKRFQMRAKLKNRAIVSSSALQNPSPCPSLTLSLSHLSPQLAPLSPPNRTKRREQYRHRSTQNTKLHAFPVAFQRKKQCRRRCCSALSSLRSPS